MSKTQTIDPADVICGLKAAVTALECYHGMELLRQQEHLKKIEKPPPPPMYMMIPIEENKPDRKPPALKPMRHKEEEPKETRVKNGNHEISRSRRCVEKKEEIHCDDPSDIPCLIYPEMRGGILFDRCSCVHRDGLQDSCPLTQCQGQPECVTKPWPICPPGKFKRQRFPELFPMPESCKSV